MLCLQGIGKLVIDLFHAPHWRAFARRIGMHEGLSLIDRKRESPDEHIGEPESRVRTALSAHRRIDHFDISQNAVHPFGRKLASGRTGGLSLLCAAALETHAPTLRPLDVERSFHGRNLDTEAVAFPWRWMLALDDRLTPASSPPFGHRLLVP